MRKVERLRVGLVVGAVLLLVAVFGSVTYARYRAARGWLQRAKQHSGVTIERESDNVTYSQSVGGRTLFTLHASTGIQHKDGHWTLHDVVLTLYGFSKDRADRVYGKEFEWDEAQGIARAVGDVQMDLQVPRGVANAERKNGASTAAASAGDEESIHVVTSGLTFVKKLGVAATDQPIEFRYGGMVCTARGAELDQTPSALHLLADVHAYGEVRGAMTDLHAAKADYRRDTGMLVAEDVHLTTPGRTLSGREAQVHLRTDGSVEHVTLDRDVVLVDAKRGGRLTAARMDGAANENNQPVLATFGGGVHWVASDGRGTSTDARAAGAEMHFDARSVLSAVVATGGVKFASHGAEGAREVSGERATGTFAKSAKGKSALQQLEVEAGARARSVSAGGRVSTTTDMAGDTLRAVLRPSTGGARATVDAVFGQGHTTVHETASDGSERTSTADAMEVHLRSGAAKKGAGEIASATEDGHVLLMSRAAVKAARAGAAKAAAPEVMHGGAAHAVFNGDADTLTLTGEAAVDDAGRSLRARTIVFHHGNGDAEADGAVTATFAGAAEAAAATHVSAERARLQKAAGTAAFTGGAGGLAKLWQGASQVQAAEIDVDNKRGVLVARPLAADGVVESVFASVGTATRAKPGSAGASTLRVRSSRLEFANELHRATFAGPVAMDGLSGKVTGDQAEAFFAPKAAVAAKGDAAAGVDLESTSLERVVLSGNVRITQPGREGTGTQLVYRAADGSFLLTGTAAAAPRVRDAAQGEVTGTSLLLRPGDSTIVVSGAGATSPAAPGVDGKQRARIQTRLRQKAQ